MDGGQETTERLPVYAVSHGGGPWPWLRDGFLGDWGPLERALQAVPGEVGVRPRAIVCVTAHWIGRDFTVQTAAQPPMLYDYGGFPDHTYRVSYPAPGSPELAERIVELVGAAGLTIGRDARRGFDHGTFVPLAVAFPDASIPVVQLSIRADFDPAAHLRLGRAIAPLRDEGVLVFCSGVLTYHNFSAMGPEALGPSTEFDRWLTDTVVGHVGPERSRLLEDWAEAPSARRCHPMPDHLLPLMVAAGAAEDDPAVVQYHEDAFMQMSTSTNFRFDAARRTAAVAG